MRKYSKNELEFESECVYQGNECLSIFTTDVVRHGDDFIGYERSSYWIRINDIKAHSREGFSRMMVELATIAKKEGYSELQYDGSDETSIYYLEGFGFREVWRDNHKNISLRANI